MSFSNSIFFGVRIAAAFACIAGFASVSDAAPRKGAMPAVTGLAAMHDMRREGGRLCFSDHFHYGSSNGEKSMKAAQAAAIRSWADFVIFEYDPSWANFGKSGSKEIKCAPGGGGWSCDVSSRPCR